MCRASPRVPSYLRARRFGIRQDWWWTPRPPAPHPLCSWNPFASFYRRHLTDVNYEAMVVAMSPRTMDTRLTNCGRGVNLLRSVFSLVSGTFTRDQHRQRQTDALVHSASYTCRHRADTAVPQLLLSHMYVTGDTPLFLALRGDHHHMARFLICEGANVTHTNHLKQNLMHVACIQVP